MFPWFANDLFVPIDVDVTVDLLRVGKLKVWRVRRRLWRWRGSCVPLKKKTIIYFFPLSIYISCLYSELIFFFYIRFAKPKREWPAFALTFKDGWIESQTSLICTRNTNPVSQFKFWYWKRIAPKMCQKVFFDDFTCETKADVMGETRAEVRAEVSLWKWTWNM